MAISHDPYARFYQRFDGDGPRVAAMFETIGCIVIAWGSAETVLAKMWWHKAFQAGTEMPSEKPYRATTADKLKALRKLIPRDGSRADAQLQRIDGAMLDLEPERHALVHGYLSMTARGPAVLNLRNGKLAFAIDLPRLEEWAIYLADVAHQMHEEATCHIYHGVDRLYLPDPIEPAAYVRTTVGG